MFEAMGMENFVKQVVDNGKAFTKFIYNHDWVVARVRQACGRSLIRQGDTQFAMNYLGLSSFAA